MGRIVGAGLALAVLALVSPGQTSEPRGGSISETQPTIAWSGSLLAPTGYIVATDTCAPVSHAGCDLFGLAVDAPAGQLVTVDASSPAYISWDVIAADGRTMAEGFDDPTRHSPATFIHDPRRSPYVVRVTLRIRWSYSERPEPYEAIAALGGLLADMEVTCDSDLVPAAVESPAEPANLRSLRVHVLLDGTPLPYAMQVMDRASLAYDRSDIDLTITYEDAPFTGHTIVEADELFDQARARFGGARPPHADVVYILTERDLTGSIGSSVAGQADCVGGVQSPVLAFAAGEARSNAGRRPVEEGAIIAAHEIGHLLGAHHHYAACGPGLLDPAISARVCTVMFPDIGFGSLRFSPLSHAVIRGYLGAEG